MKKWIGVGLLALLLIGCGAAVSEGAKAVSIESTETDGTVYAARVDNDRNVMVEEDGNLYKFATESDLVYTGVCTLKAINVVGASAGDSVIVFDDVDTTRNLTVAQVMIGANTSSASWSIPGGIDLTTGIYVIGTDSAVDTTIVYQD